MVRYSDALFSYVMVWYSNGQSSTKDIVLAGWFPQITYRRLKVCTTTLFMFSVSGSHSYWLTPTIILANKQTIWNVAFKKFGIQMFPVFKWSVFKSPLFLEKKIVIIGNHG